MYILHTLISTSRIVTSFLEVGPALLVKKDVKFFLTGRISQDPLESYFGDQRSRGHRNTNPTLQQFGVTANILRVSSGLSKKERGNVRGLGRTINSHSNTHMSLRKRKQKRTRSMHAVI
jgi:hypothetical protein